MARRDLEVRVRADVGAYQKAMSAAVSSTDELAQAGLRMQKLGLSVSNLGDTLTKNVTLPLVAIGAVATKMAMDFDKSFTTMQTLAGVTSDEVEGLKDSVLDLAGETGRAPQELAEALYFLQSSGLDSAQAMEALEVSAKASAAGLGDTATIADAVSSAMLGYAKSGLSAAEATDVLVATAREGKAEPAELANQMGRLIPVASELGIKFGDVGGAIAALSTKGFNAEQATTALVNVMAKLLKPSEQAAKLLESVGLSTDTIRQSIAEKGLLATLEELKAKLGDAGFVKFLEDQQAVQGGLALLGGDLNKTKEIIEAVNNSAGATDNAFSKWAESMGAENARAFAEFQVALINMGDIIAPIATTLINAISGIAEAFGSLPGGVQQAIVYAALFAAALGPILSIGGRVITTAGTLIRVLNDLALPAGTVAGAFNQTNTAAAGTAVSFGRVAAAASLGAVGIGLIAFSLHSMAQARQAAELDKIAEGLATITNTSDEMGQSIIRRADDWGKLDEAFEASLELGQAQAERFIEMAEAAGIADDKIDGLRSRLEEKSSADAQAAVDSETNAAATRAAAEAMDAQAAATEGAVSALQQYSDALKAQFDPLFGAIDASIKLQDANTKVAEAEMAAAAAAAEFGAGSLEAAAAGEELRRAHLEAGQAAVGQEGAVSELASALLEQGLSADAAKGKLATWVAEGKITQATADAVSAEIDGVTASAYAIPGARHIDITASTGGALNEIGAVRFAIASLPSNKNIEVNVSLTGAASGLVGQRLTFRQHGGPVKAGQAYVVGEHQPELFIPETDGTIMPSVPPSASPTAWGGGWTSTARYRDLWERGIVRLGEVLDAEWKALLRLGWQGYAGDKMEALYPPLTQLRDGILQTAAATSQSMVAAPSVAAAPTANPNADLLRYANLSRVGPAGNTRTWDYFGTPDGRRWAVIFATGEVISVGQLPEDSAFDYLQRIGKLHTGGRVPGSPGQERLAILEAGEYVTPARGPIGHSGMGGGGGDIHLTVNVAAPFGSPAEIGTKVVEAIQAHERSNGPRWRQ